VARGLHSPLVDGFAIVLLGAIAALVLWFWLLGRYFPGSGLEQVGLRPARQIVEERERLEAEDLDQMMAAHNARRRRRGENEMTVADFELRVADDFRDQRRRSREYLADRDVEELLEVTNARRRARGLPERTREDVERSLGAAGTQDGGEGKLGAERRPSS
jgi:hypothetical protein